MPLPRSCSACGGVHQPGQTCGLRPSKTAARFGPGWASISRRVIERDGGICHLCGLPGADTTDHLEPRNGRAPAVTDESRLAAAHRRCNSSRGNRPLVRFVGSVA